MHRITGASKVVGLFGFPVEHSLSPIMHNAALAQAGLQYIYIPLSVLPEDIGQAILSLKALGIVGVNLTIPHKQRVIPYLDEISSEAVAIGAVNTVINSEGKLKGTNTDGIGFTRSLVENNFELMGKRAVVLGAGGASRSVVYQMLSECSKVTVVSRDADQAKKMIAELSGSRQVCETQSLTYSDIGIVAKVVGEADILVNATSVGMHPNVNEHPPIDTSLLNSKAFVYDLIYNPVETKLLSNCGSRGIRTLNGLSMLVHQGAESFRLWTGVDPDVECMYRAAQGGLRELILGKQ